MTRLIYPSLQAPPAFVSAAPENVTVDKWYIGLSQPNRPRPLGLPVRLQRDEFFVKSAPFGETVLLGDWFAPLSLPVRLKPGSAFARNQQAEFLVKAPPFAENVLISDWFAPLSLPVRVKLGSPQALIASGESFNPLPIPKAFGVVWSRGYVFQ